MLNHQLSKLSVLRISQSFLNEGYNGVLMSTRVS